MRSYIKLPSNLIVQIIFVLLWSPAFALAADEPLHSGPAVIKLHTTLLSNMRASLDYQARYKQLQPTVKQVFDSPAIARVSLGATWRKLSGAEQKEFTQVVMNTVAATYADRFIDFNGQKFDVLGEFENRPGRWVVKTVLTKSDGGTVNLDYYIKGGRIFNVIADGVSDLSLRRADYAAVIKQKGYLFLLASLKTKLAELGN